MRRLVYGVLTVVAVVGGVALAGSGARTAASEGAATPTPAFSILDGYKCPAGQGIANVIVDGWEHRPTTTPQRAIAVAIAGQPQLPFDAEARVDLDKSPREATFALRDPDGNLLARVRAERVLDGWVFAGWTSCGGLGDAASSDSEPSVAWQVESSAPSDASNSGSTDTNGTKSIDTPGRQDHRKI